MEKISAPKPNPARAENAGFGWARVAEELPGTTLQLTQDPSEESTTFQSRPQGDANGQLPQVRVTVRLEAVRRIMVRRHGHARVLLRGVPLIMEDHRVWAEDVLPPSTRQAVTEVNVFEVHEVALVESADRIKSIPAHEQTRAGQPTGRAGFREVLPRLVCTCLLYTSDAADDIALV